MLWIGGQITTLAIIEGVFLAALANLLVPLLVTSYMLRGRVVVAPPSPEPNAHRAASEFDRNLMFFLGIGCLVAVPVFKT